MFHFSLSPSCASHFRLEYLGTVGNAHPGASSVHAGKEMGKIELKSLGFLSPVIDLSFRKKLSNFLHTQNWKSAYNYVAKQYIESVSRDVYFEDVRLQMEAKLWGEEYNRHKPPKQVHSKIWLSKNAVLSFSWVSFWT